MAQTDDKAAEAQRAEIFKRTLRIAGESDSAKAMEFLESQGKPNVVAEHYSKLLKEIYFKKKDVPLLVIFWRTGIQYALAAAKANEKTDADAAKKLTGTAKTIAYNLAANTWPGWQDEGIEITKPIRAIGFDAAMLNLRLAGELKRDAEVFDDAHWLVGAYYLAAGEGKHALAQFRTSAEKFREAKKAEFELMAKGYAGMARATVETTKDEGTRQLQEAIDTLKKNGSEDAKFFAQQLADVRKLFVK